METRTFKYYRDLVLVLIAKELKLRYKSTFLGYAWSIFHPLAFALVYFIAFKVVMRIQMENYALFLICGLFPWQWFANSTVASNTFFIMNSSLIKKVKFPRQFLVLTGVLNDLIHFVASIPVIVGFMFYYHQCPSVSWLYQVPLLAVILFGITYGLSLLIASCNLFFRDLERLTSIFVTLWFFMTPIIYPVKMIPESLQWIVYVNPMASVVICWQSVFLEGVLPLDHCVVSICFSVLAYELGINVYRRLQWRFAEIV